MFKPRLEQHPNAMKLDDLTKNELRTALNAEPANMELRETTDANPGLVLLCQSAPRQVKQLATFSSGCGYGPGWEPRWNGGGIGGCTV